MNSLEKHAEHQAGLKSIDDIENKHLRAFWRIIGAVLVMTGKILLALFSAIFAVLAIGAASEDDENRAENTDDYWAHLERDTLDPNSPNYIPPKH